GACGNCGGAGGGCCCAFTPPATPRASGAIIKAFDLPLLVLPWGFLYVTEIPPLQTQEKKKKLLPAFSFQLQRKQQGEGGSIDRNLVSALLPRKRTYRQAG